MFQYASTEGSQQLMELTLEGLFDLRHVMDEMERTMKARKYEVNALIENIIILGG